jgi:hypothetical protein
VIYTRLSVISTSLNVIYIRMSVILTRLNVISTRKVRFSHVKCDFNKHECNFHSHNCDLDTHECESDTQTCYSGKLVFIKTLDCGNSSDLMSEVIENLIIFEFSEKNHFFLIKLQIDFNINFEYRMCRLYDT